MMKKTTLFLFTCLFSLSCLAQKRPLQLQLGTTISPLQFDDWNILLFEESSRALKPGFSIYGEWLPIPSLGISAGGNYLTNRVDLSNHIYLLDGTAVAEDVTLKIRSISWGIRALYHITPHKSTKGFTDLYFGGGFEAQRYNIVTDSQSPQIEALTPTPNIDNYRLYGVVGCRYYFKDDFGIYGEFALPADYVFSFGITYPVDNLFLPGGGVTPSF